MSAVKVKIQPKQFFPSGPNGLTANFFDTQKLVHAMKNVLLAKIVEKCSTVLTIFFLCSYLFHGPKLN